MKVELIVTDDEIVNGPRVHYNLTNPKVIVETRKPAMKDMPGIITVQFDKAEKVND